MSTEVQGISLVGNTCAGEVLNRWVRGETALTRQQLDMLEDLVAERGPSLVEILAKVNTYSTQLVWEQIKKHLDGIMTSTLQILTLNTEMAMIALGDPSFYRVLSETSADGLVVPDSVGVVWALQYLGIQAQVERVGGVDLAEALFTNLASQGVPFFLLGAEDQVREQGIKNLVRKYGIKIAGDCGGRYGRDDSWMIEQIRTASQEVGDRVILIIAANASVGEIFINAHKGEFENSCSIAMNVGQGIDVWGKKVNRAPQFMLERNLEWLYRVVTRFDRVHKNLSLPVFAALVYLDKATQRKGC